MPRSVDFAEKRRILQLETLYDLALSLQADRPEESLVEELLQRVCMVLDPSAGIAVTRDGYGGTRAVTSVGWPATPSGDELLSGSLWRELLAQGQPLTRRDGALLGRPYREVVAAPLQYRDVYLGFVALLDKEARGGGSSAFSDEDRRFLDSVAVLGGVALDGARQIATLQTQRERLAEENKALREKLTEDMSGNRIIAASDAMVRVLEMIERIAPRGISVLLRGESGTGKELIAKLIHVQSGREGPLVALNCAAIPESLLESELFGIEGGVATGVEARRGKFALADGGTLFLDEIGDLQPSLQVKLLRTLQEREVTPVGSHSAIPVDVRIIAATHRPLESLVEQQGFRGDLYYRLRGVEMELPPLRERRQEIPLMLRDFTERFCRREGVEPPHWTSEALALLLAHDYPGNVRELKNLVEGAVSLADGVVDVAMLRGLVSSSTVAEDSTSLDLKSVERRHIARVIRLAGNNKSAAARMLGVDRRTLQRKGF